jgi:hypothetical protein
MTATTWYWCLTHERAETADERDHPENALGPFESPDAARDWKDRNEERAQKWKQQDQAWEGDDADDEPV